ncbi:hypothetical protein [Streptomyces sp. NBC_00893]|uniref:hypothetical protein n=1 Tax=Streptomyces sp. NBC_00893 TaxID=2975862 RepID=UPI00224D70F0|nr:hypothetical protein [Streptomyces sp. NBC_00893]MCX4851654.1 hypothetical protein [Streptomyces sp. NBC_00893]
MTRRLPSIVLPVLLTVAVTGCGVTTTAPTHAGAPASGIQRPGTTARTVQLYFAGPYGIRAVNRPTDRPLSPQQALDLLLEGPTPAERDRGLITHVPPMAGQLTATPTSGAVDIYVPRTVSSGDLDVTAVAQLACTAAHAHIPGDRPATQIDIRIHENLTPSQTPWTVRCGPNGTVTPVTG